MSLEDIYISINIYTPTHPPTYNPSTKPTPPAMATITELLSYQKPKVLTQSQIDSFMTHGFLRLPGAIIPEKGEEWTRNVWHRLGMDPNDKSTWHTERTNMPSHSKIDVKQVAPVAWDAICDLCGGEERVSESGKKWSDGFIVNLGSEETEGRRLGPKELDNCKCLCPIALRGCVSTDQKT